MGLSPGQGTSGQPGGSDSKESACNAGELGSTPIPWRRKWQPTPVFLPGEFHGQRCLAGYSPWGHKELDTTGQLTLSLSGNQDLTVMHGNQNKKKTHTKLK